MLYSCFFPPTFYFQAVGNREEKIDVYLNVQIHENNQTIDSYILLTVMLHFPPVIWFTTISSLHFFALQVVGLRSFASTFD